ncbi:hypothetical protein AC578_6559 [Pseudocercospora eumusae]|uniref:F-box domain-containing protein n=1 Tax=Pseudocercospora eumusae TaxID=321146 RepID=A0A139HHM3_9PEZI|nr:hypothetical protein AC578_6559 [Pseudocercospora eumusae]
MTKRKAAPAGQSSRRSKRIAQRRPEGTQTQPNFQAPGSAVLSQATSQGITSPAASFSVTSGPINQNTSTSTGHRPAVVGAAATRKVFAIAELLTEILQYLDLASLSLVIRTNRLFNREGTTAPSLKSIWFLSPSFDAPSQYEVDHDNQMLRQTTSTANDESTHGRNLISVYQINPMLRLRREDDLDENASPLERLLSLEGHTDLDLPYQSIDTSKWIKIPDMQLTKPAIREVQFNYAPEDDNADKVNLEIFNPNGITVGDIIDAVKARGDAPTEPFLTARLWHRDVLLLRRKEVEELESLTPNAERNKTRLNSGSARASIPIAFLPASTIFLRRIFAPDLTNTSSSLRIVPGRNFTHELLTHRTTLPFHSGQPAEFLWGSNGDTTDAKVPSDELNITNHTGMHDFLNQVSNANALIVSHINVDDRSIWMRNGCKADFRHRWLKDQHVAKIRFDVGVVRQEDVFAVCDLFFEFQIAAYVRFVS